MNRSGGKCRTELDRIRPFSLVSLTAKGTGGKCSFIYVFWLIAAFMTVHHRDSISVESRHLQAGTRAEPQRMIERFRRSRICNELPASATTSTYLALRREM